MKTILVIAIDEMIDKMIDQMMIDPEVEQMSQMGRNGKILIPASKISIHHNLMEEPKQRLNNQ